MSKSKEQIKGEHDCREGYECDPKRGRAYCQGYTEQYELLTKGDYKAIKKGDKHE
jgi:hypothetical protein